MRVRTVELIMSCVLAGCAGAASSAEPASAPEPVPPTQGELACADGAPPDGSPADRLSWMIGTWVSHDDDSATTERWCVGEGGALVGDNVTRAGGDVVHSERLRVEARGDRLVYVASPSGQATTEFSGDARCGSDVLEGDGCPGGPGRQPCGEPSSGRSTETGPSSNRLRSNCERSCEATFENPEHDFPNEITYARCVQNDLLVATIRGGDRRASWTFRRVDP